MATYFAAAALFIVCVAFVISPLLEKRQLAQPLPTLLESLDAERQTIIRNMRDLDDDYRLGKIAEADYHFLRLAQVQQGTTILSQIEQLQLQQKPLPKSDNELEREIYVLRSKKY